MRDNNHKARKQIRKTSKLRIGRWNLTFCNTQSQIKTKHVYAIKAQKREKNHALQFSFSKQEDAFPRS